MKAKVYLLLILLVFSASCDGPALEPGPHEELLVLVYQPPKCECPPYGFYLEGKRPGVRTIGEKIQFVGKLKPGPDRRCEGGHLHKTFIVRDYKLYSGLLRAQNKQGYKTQRN